MGWLGVYKKWETKFTDSKLNVEHPQHLSHIYDTLTFIFECQGWGVGVVISHSTPPPPYPQNLSHIYDTLTFMFECQGWGGGGGL